MAGVVLAEGDTVIRKPNHLTRPNRYNAARDPYLAELRNAPYGKPVAAVEVFS